MPQKPQIPRHKIQLLDSGIQIILPSKKNIFNIIGYILFLIMWGYISGAIIYILMVITKIAIWAGDISAAFNIFSIFITLLLILLLSFGSLVISSFFRHIFGKEVVKVSSQVMSISFQIFGLEKISKYSSYSLDSIKNLRVSIPQKAKFAPLESIKILLGKNGIIAFEYGEKTFRFGLEIDEAEATQMIHTIKERLPQQTAG